MKRIILTIVVIKCALMLSAQNEVDALRYSQFIQTGTARFNSMAGAYGALGGDLSVMAANPAGIGVYRKSDLGISLTWSGNNVDSKFNGVYTSDFENSFRPTNAGFVIAQPSYSDGWKFINYGFSYNQLADYNSAFSIHGNNTSSSILDWEAEKINTDLNPNQAAQSNPFVEADAVFYDSIFGGYTNDFAYMLDKDKWQKTDDFVKESKYDELKKSADIKWYLSVVDSDKFSKLNEWKLTFEDDFTTNKVDDKKWMNSFFWGKMLLNDRYVMAGDQHYYTDDKNIELNNSILKIVTKTEAARGKVWHPLHGFSEKDFKYTSGMISTAHSFRQQYGKFEAKIKLDASFPAYLAFWLKGEKILPEIDVFKFNMDKKNRFQMSTHFGDPSNVKSAQKVTSKIGGSNLTNDFYIYSFEWSPEKITWRINDYEVFSSINGIPNEPLYLIISAGVQKDIPLENSASQFEIDWVRCYEKI